MVSFAQRLEDVSLSGIRAVFEAADENAINLGLGQPDFNMPEQAREAVIDAIRGKEIDAYTVNKGTEEVREAIVRKYERDNDLQIGPGNIIATSGASEALHIALQAHVDPGETVLVPNPGFVAYDALVRIAGGQPEPVTVQDQLTLDPADVEAAITEDTAAFIVNSPANPTGGVQTPEEMREFAQIADAHDVICITDEVYEKIVFEGTHRSPFEFAETDHVLAINGCSKTYAMTGWRLGWVTASSRRIEAMLRVHQFMQGCASAPAQAAGAAALTGPQDAVEQMRDAFEERRDIMLDGLDDAGLRIPKPQGAFYVMPEVPEGWVDAVIDNGVIVVPGEAFGSAGSGHARISYATDKDRLKDALSKIRTATATVM